MTDFQLKPTQNGVQIDLNASQDAHTPLLAAFQECQQGRCSCPTMEYQKLASLDIHTSQDGLQLLLEALPGQTFDPAEIEKCLEYTVKAVTPEPS